MTRQMTLRRTALSIAFCMLVFPEIVSALCGSPLEPRAAAETPPAYRYAWFLVESLSQARLAWQEVDSGAASQSAVTRLARFKLAVEDFQCAASLVQTFQTARESDELTTEMLQASATAATSAYTTFVGSFQRWATALAQRGGLPLEEAADLKVENEKAGELLIHSAGAAGFALLRSSPDSKRPMDRLNVTRAQRTALREGLRRRFPGVGKHAVTESTHTPDLAADVFYTFLSNPRYKAADEP